MDIMLRIAIARAMYLMKVSLATLNLAEHANGIGQNGVIVQKHVEVELGVKTNIVNAKILVPVVIMLGIILIAVDNLLLL